LAPALREGGPAARDRSRPDFRPVPDRFSKLPERFSKVPDGFAKLPDGLGNVPERFRTLPEGFRNLPDPVRKLPETFRKLPEGYWPSPLLVVQRRKSVRGAAGETIPCPGGPCVRDDRLGELAGRRVGCLLCFPVCHISGRFSATRWRL
jgi:hypothetical protein